MRQFQICVPDAWFITESKARIDHPEDLVLDNGSQGARRALSALLHAARSPSDVTIKWDGSPAIIFGRDDDGFVLTDKSGFSKRQSGGMPRTSADLASMLFMRKPDQPGREEYSKNIAGLFDTLGSILPAGFRGYLMGDVLYTSQPPVENGHFVFKPNKVTYRIPVNSDLGKLIGKSKAGIVLHGIYADQDSEESTQIGNLASLGLKPSSDVVIMGPEIKDLKGVGIPESTAKKMDGIISGNASALDSFLNKSTLTSQQISDLPARMKQYINQMAYTGKIDYDAAPAGFVTWIQDPSAKISERKQANMLSYIKTHHKGYMAAWSIVAALSALKDYIRKGVDKQVGSTIDAELHGLKGHEGYVADTPAGKIKMVNRPHFMRKDSEHEIS